MGITLLAIGIGDNIREKELESIASWPPDRNIMLAADYNALDLLVARVLDAISNSKPCTFSFLILKC